MQPERPEQFDRVLGKLVIGVLLRPGDERPARPGGWCTRERGDESLLVGEALEPRVAGHHVSRPAETVERDHERERPAPRLRRTRTQAVRGAARVPRWSLSECPACAAQPALAAPCAFGRAPAMAA